MLQDVELALQEIGLSFAEGREKLCWMQVGSREGADIVLTSGSRAVYASAGVLGVSIIAGQGV